MGWTSWGRPKGRRSKGGPTSQIHMIEGQIKRLEPAATLQLCRSCRQPSVSLRRFYIVFRLTSAPSLITATSHPSNGTRLTCSRHFCANEICCPAGEPRKPLLPIQTDVDRKPLQQTFILCRVFALQPTSSVAHRRLR